MDNYKCRFFLGSNSGKGFCSFYDNFVSPNEDIILYIIKGGPGSGKSSFMKKIAYRAEKAGYDVEYIYCSGDPGSLDAIKIPQLGAAFCDGTSPHAIEPKFAGVCEVYIDLSQFYDKKELIQRKNTIIHINTAYKKLYSQAYQLLEAASSIEKNIQDSIESDILRRKIHARFKGIASREIPKANLNQGKISQRFLEGITCTGNVIFYDTIKTLADKVYIVDNELGLSSIALPVITEKAVNSGLDTIICYDPLIPSKVSHVLIPTLSLAFVSQTGKQKYEGEYHRHIRLDSTADTPEIRKLRSHIKSCKNAESILLEQSTKILASAKSMHDSLEDVYNPCVDFDGVYDLADKTAKLLNI